MKRKLFSIYFCLFFISSEIKAIEAPSQRILFIIDGSGSMKEIWHNESKWNIAKETLTNMIDSISKKNNSVEFAIRVLGHQFPRTAENCQDTKLEIPFSSNHTLKNISTILNAITPQGHTPIAYSLLQSVNDFTPKTNVINTVILITDGFETCKGDPCEVSKELRRKNIVISPYIIGLGVDVKYHENLKCVGTFVDVTDKASFTTVVRKIIHQTISKTSCQLVIKDKQGNLVGDQINYTIYDQVTGNVMNNYIYALKKNETTDTLFLNPQGTYNIQVHSNPSLVKTGVQINPGTHTIISFVLDQGAYATKTTNKNLMTVVRKQDEIIQTQNPIEVKNYLTQNSYDLEILSLPYQAMKEIGVSTTQTQYSNINQTGIVYFGFETDGVGSVFDAEMNKMKEIHFTKSREQLELLPGKYSFVYRTNNRKKSLATISIPFEIQSGKTIPIAVK